MSITIRRVRLADAAAVARVQSDPAVFGQLLQMPHGDEELYRARIADTCAPGKQDLWLVAEVDGEVVGNAGIHPMGPSLRRRHVMGLGMAVASTHQGKGVGSALMQALCDYADRWAQVLRLELTVYTDNARAIALYRKFGFEIEGTLKAYAFRDGVYVDVFTMARLHPQPARW